jgi:hypothetical protein
MTPEGRLVVFLLLHDSGDPAVPWLAAGLRAHGVAPLESVTGHELAAAPRWEHRLDGSGDESEVRLADGRVLSSRALRGALNRLGAIPGDSMAVGLPRDRAYALQELTALVASWLHSLPGPVLNRPRALGLSGPWLHRSEWTRLAAEAGLPVEPYVETSLDPASGWTAPPFPVAATAFVVADEVLATSLPEGLAAGCRRLVELAHAQLLAVHFAHADDWRFMSASAVPDLRAGGDAVLALLAGVLTGEYAMAAVA